MLELTDKEFTKLIQYMKSNYGINLIQKRTLVNGRLSNILTENNHKNFSEYFESVINDTSGESIKNLVNKLTTNHTFFLRETAHFDYYKDIVLPYFKNTIKDFDLRVWSAGCSSGEEPYTIAMINSDFFDKDFRWDTKILATDISSKVLETAKSGVYNDEQIKSLHSNWKLNYLNKLPDRKFEIKSKIKSNVVFRNFNLNIKSFPFKRKFHVIFCRNVMIYFDNETKDILLEKFYNYLEPGGYLFIGHSESIKHEQSKFKYVMPATYRKE
jgi:chemotaxis protein methyltransferase CheR